MKIGILSDTHSYLDPKVFTHFADVDEIWHAGDIGNPEVTAELAKFKPLCAVYGNIDSKELQLQFPEISIFSREGVKVLMVHIAGKTGVYTARLKKIIQEEKPALLVCGHSHIIKVVTDPVFAPMLYINPGAAGREGFHKKKTLIKMELAAGKIVAMQAIELGGR